MAGGMKIVIKDPQSNVKIERLKALGATTFGGTNDPYDAKIWVDTLQKCLDVMGCPEDRKVRLATFLLEGGASEWWKSVRSEIRSWNEFKKAFYEEYYPRSYRDAKRSEFLKLVQGSMSVVEYEKKYIELSKHATSIIEDEVEKCTRFENGLREDIRSSISGVEWREFRRLVEAALRMERKSEEEESSGDIEIELVGHGTSKSSCGKMSRRKQVMRGSPICMKPEHPNHVELVDDEAQPTPRHSNTPPKLKQHLGTPHTHGKLFLNTQQQQLHK